MIFSSDVRVIYEQIKAGTIDTYDFQSYLDEVTNVGYDKGYGDGQEAGHNEGYNEGMSDGDSEGYDRGYEDGKDVGYKNGLEDGYE